MEEQLFITEFDSVYLPEEYHFAHNIAVRLHDDLVWLVKDKKIQNKLNVTIKFEKGDKQPSKNEKDIFDWLIKSGRQDVVDEIISKNVSLAVTSDICHFVFQALDSAKKYKMAVAYALIRKPFLENLIIIEQLLVDEKKFLINFEANPEKFDPGKLNDVQKNYLIEKSLSKIKSDFLDQEIIFQLRFDKTNPDSLYALTNLATHLVTTRHPQFKTESNNLNFIFSGHEEWDAQHSHFYYFIPYILCYTAEVIDRYLYEKKMITSGFYKKRKFYRLIAQILLHDNIGQKSINGNSTANKITRTMKIRCKSCKKNNQLYKSDLFTLINNKYILCKYCLIDLYTENNSFDEIIKKVMKI